MSLSNLNTDVTYAWGGGAASLAIPFAYQDTSEVEVHNILISTGVATLLVEPTDYTLSPTTVFPTPIAAGSYQIRISRKTARTQPVSYINNSGFLAEDHEEALDHLGQLAQEAAAVGDASLKLSLYDIGRGVVDTTMPKLVVDKTLAVNPTGDGFVWVDGGAHAVAAAEAAALTASTQAGIATGAAGTASTQAGIATTQAGIATTQAGIATNAAIAAAAFNPMTAGGDIIYGGVSGVATKLSNGTAGQYLKSNGTTLAPSWGNLSVTPVKTSNYTVSVSDEVVLLSSASGYITVTMYTPVGNAGRTVKLIKYDSSFNQIGVAGTGLSTTLATLNEAITLVSDGTNWSITNRYIDSTSRVTTITGSWTTNTTYSGVSWRVGDRLFVQGKILLTGAPNATVLSITIPNGLVIDTSKVPGGVGTQMPLGKTLCEDSGVTSYGLGTFRYGSTTVLNTLSGTITGSTTSLNNNITHATPFTFGNADSVTFQFDVPIVGWEG